MTRFHRLTVSDIRRETESAVSIAFRVPEELREEFSFKPGQFLTLRTRIDGSEVRRTYSICSALGESELRVAIKHVKDGQFSTFANRSLRTGETLDVMAPDGRFVANIDGSKGYEVVCFAAGSGITPILSITRSLLEGEAEACVKLFYGNRNSNSIIFREALEDLKDRFLERFQLFHVLSREQQDVALFDGRIDATRVALLVAEGLIDPNAGDGFFICGPGDMIEAVSAALAALGVDERKIHFERFSPAGGETPRPAKPLKPITEAVQQGVEVAVILDGTRRSFAVVNPSDAILHAAHKAGLELPYSCAGGMCCTCRCRVIEGSVEMAVNYSLQPWEIEAGFALACQARPTSNKLVLDFDAV